MCTDIPETKIEDVHRHSNSIEHDQRVSPFLDIQFKPDGPISPISFFTMISTSILIFVTPSHTRQLLPHLNCLARHWCTVLPQQKQQTKRRMFPMCWKWMATLNDSLTWHTTPPLRPTLPQWLLNGNWQFSVLFTGSFWVSKMHPGPTLNTGMHQTFHHSQIAAFQT